MIEVRGVIEDAKLAQDLEDWFCEWVRSPWSLVQVKSGDPYQLSGYFETEDLASAEWADLRVKFKKLPDPEFVSIADEDWKEAYKLHFSPWSSRGLHWVPLWEKDRYELPAGEVALYLDPGMAFGTGSHETTRLCAERMLDFRDRRGAMSGLTLIDAGCGSGILALSGALLGFGEVFGFDNDPEAAKVSMENREMNPAASAASFAEAGLAEGLGGRQADLLLANIQADVLMLYAEEILQAIRPGGEAGLSGILAKEIEDVRMKFLDTATRLEIAVEADTRTLGEWADLRIGRV